MKLYEIEEDRVILKTKRTPLFVRAAFFVFAFLPIIITMTGIFLYRKNFQIVYLISILFSGVIGFYLLRIALWNTCGKEVIRITDSKLEYQVDYGWFKSRRESLDLDSVHLYTGWVEEAELLRLRRLLIDGKEKHIEVHIKLTQIEMNRVIMHLKSLIQKRLEDSQK